MKIAPLGVEGWPPGSHARSISATTKIQVTLQGLRARDRLDGRRLRSRRSAPQPGRWAFRSRPGLLMAMAASGGRGELVAGDNGFGLAFKADALWVGTRTDAASGASGDLVATSTGSPGCARRSKARRA